jgi:AcrR family transcriptional regulator
LNWGSIVEQEAGLRARKKQRTKADLERAAMRLFAERGFDAVTVDDIAAAVDVSARTFFRHFGSKDDVLMSFHRERLELLRTQLANRPPDESPLLAVRQAMVAMAEDYEADREDLFLRTRLMADTPSLVGRSLEIQQQWELVIADAVAARLGVAVDADLRPAHAPSRRCVSRRTRGSPTRAAPTCRRSSTARCCSSRAAATPPGGPPRRVSGATGSDPPR